LIKKLNSYNFKIKIKFKKKINFKVLLKIEKVKNIEKQMGRDNEDKD